MKLIVGKLNIQNVSREVLSTNEPIGNNSLHVTYRTPDGNIYPALIIFEKTDFKEIIIQNECSI